MKKSDYGILFLVALIFFSLIATFQKVPGYMDAEYYFGQGLRIIQHHDLQEVFIWNFLNDPTSTTVPGFTFWLPLTSIFTAGGVWVSGSTSYFGARVLFILMAACITLMAAFFATEFLPLRRAGWLAGLLTLFSGFYLPFITITDTFTPYMFLGGLYFLSLWLAERKSRQEKGLNFWFLATGVITGLMSLTRSDGVLWLAGGLLGILFVHRIHNKTWKKVIIDLGFGLLGFALVMAPWYIRNYSLFQSIMPPGNSLMLWLTKYNDLFVYPSNGLTISRWISSGFFIILLDRLKALLSNMQTLIASGGLIFLSPIMAIGVWKTRKSFIAKIAWLMLTAILAVMTFVFPYAGERGGFFHSLAAVQVILWSMVPVGLDAIIQWGVKHRKWKTNRSWKMFGTALVVVAGVFSAFLFSEKLHKGTENGIPWNHTQTAFTSIEQNLAKETGDLKGVIMVNDPPGYTLATKRSSVMIPTGGESAVVEVCQRYDIHYLVINDERSEIRDLMENTGLSAHFDFLFTTAGNSVYEFKP